MAIDDPTISSGKITILYATESGRSLQYARQLMEMFSNSGFFHVTLLCMNDYAVNNLKTAEKKIMLFVTSTTGNGEPPENAKKIYEYLLEISNSSSRRSSITSLNNNTDIAETSLIVPKSNRSNSSTTYDNSAATSEQIAAKARRRQSLYYPRDAKGESEQGFLPANLQINTSNAQLNTLCNISYSVFALGCTAYPKFCAFGKQLDRQLGQQLGAKPIVPITCGDDLRGQDQAFKRWAESVFQKLQPAARPVSSTTTLRLRKQSVASVTSANLTTSIGSSWSRGRFRLRYLTAEKNCNSEPTLQVKNEKRIRNLAELHGKSSVKLAVFERKTYLQAADSPRQTMLLQFSIKKSNKTDERVTNAYEPGDHIGIFAENAADIVHLILSRLSTDRSDELCVVEKNCLANDTNAIWTKFERLPVCTEHNALTSYLDITTPPSQVFLEHLATFCGDKKDQKRMKSLAKHVNEYEHWKLFNRPHFGDVFAEFPSLRNIDPTLLLTQLPLLQPRFYSVSSSLLAHKDQIHLTVGSVRYRTQGGLGAEHFGVCSSFLERLQHGDAVAYFVRHTPSFRLLPTRADQFSSLAPIVLIGAGTGIAPFRSFWWHRYYEKQKNDTEQHIDLYYGCRQIGLDDVYADEMQTLIKYGVLTRVQVALSRGRKKTYVQELVKQNSKHIYHNIIELGGNVYVCGDANMAAAVFKVFVAIVMEYGEMSKRMAEEFMENMKIDNRYHEDIFGVTATTLLAAGRRASMAA